DLSGDPSFGEALRRVRAVCLQAYAHQDLPFEQLVEALQPERDLSRNTLFQVFFNLLNFPAGQVELPGLAIESLLPADVGAKFDITLYAEERAEGLRLDLVYNADLFDAPRMADLLEQMRMLLEQAVADPARRLSRFSLVTNGARARLPDPAAVHARAWA